MAAGRTTGSGPEDAQALPPDHADETREDAYEPEAERDDLERYLLERPPHHGD